MLRHPGRIEKAVDAITDEPRLANEPRRMREVEPTMHLQERVAHEACAIGMEIVASWLPLRPIAHVVQPHHAEGARHADQRSEIDERVLDPAARLEAAVDQQSMHAE